MTDPTNSNRFLYFFVFVVGTGTLGAEIAAARLMAPFFGASTIVWANTIGIVLVALSIGYWLGGKIADRHPHLRGMSLMVLAAAVMLAIVPLIARPLFDISVGALDSIEAGAFVGSLFGVLFLLAVPVTLLGAAAPYAIRLAVPDVEHSGTVSGRLYALSTAGSLLGTWVSALLLIPLVGTQRTFIIFAAVIATIAVVSLGRRFFAIPAALFLTLAIPVGTVKGTENGEILFETETENQYVRVIEQDDGDRVLELNEGQAVHSLYRPGTVLTDNVWDGYLVLPFAGRSEPPERMAILGNAAGTTARAYGKYFPATEIDGVEIDGELHEVGNRFFAMDENPNLTTHTADARPWLRQSEGGYDVIMVDAYRQPYIPFYLATEEFFDLIKEKLAPGGVVIVNAGHPEGNDDLEKVLGRTMAEVFPTVIRDPKEPTNTLLLGSEGPASGDRLIDALPDLPPDLRAIAATEAAKIEPRLDGGEVYTDDLAPVEWLIDKSLLDDAGDN
ncbi:MAG TPA: fused MFS/spermidine synthase [Solirubrobacterales bacterium]|nr:fused MFS/spermidine synthase [Solirubrobacterales bacterium]